MYQSLTLVGNLGGDPEMRYTPSGVPVATFSLAVSRSWVTDGQKQEKTIWFRVTCWRKLAETVSQYLTKGKQVLVIGEIEEARTYTDRNGDTKAALEVTAQTVRFIGQRGDAGSNGNHSADPTDSVSVDNGEPIPF